MAEELGCPTETKPKVARRSLIQQAWSSGGTAIFMGRNVTILQNVVQKRCRRMTGVVIMFTSSIVKMRRRLVFRDAG